MDDVSTGAVQKRRPLPGPRPAAPAPPPPTPSKHTLRSRLPGRKHLTRAYVARHASVAAIAGGVAVFAVAGLTTSTAVANLAAPKPAPATVVNLLPPQAPLIADIASASPATQKVLKADPAHVKKAAPVTHGVISGLAANGIPNVALNAYRVAAARMANVEPSCGIDWALLAGIGREESDHGRFAGAVLHADGVSTPRIIGPALDGVHWDYIPAPGNGPALDGDATYAHALGPMQFIPSTWAIYGTDATGDGVADIFNINDAALGAARYLCAAGGNLRTHDGQVRAVLAYNHSDQYLAQVLALADAYRRGVSITGIPVGITSGSLPTVTDTGYIPPANPGAPTAVDKGKGSTKPKPKPTSSASPSGSKTSPKPTTTTGTPKPSGSSTTPKPSPSGSSTSTKPKPSPTPTPTSTCNQLQILLGLCP